MRGRINKYVCLSISPAQFKRAVGLYDFTDLTNSITKGFGNIYGALGEVMVHDFYAAKGLPVEKVPDVDVWNYDLIIAGQRVEVKTKRTTVIPEDDFNCSVAATNIKQDTDLYMFVRVTEDKKFAYLIGALPKEKFFEKAEFHKSGEPDGEGWTYKADCYNVKAKDLIRIK